MIRCGFYCASANGSGPACRMPRLAHMPKRPSDEQIIEVARAAQTAPAHYLPALCSVPGCDDPPREEFELPEGFLAVACEAHCRHVEAWALSPTGAPSGARLLGTMNSNPPTGPVLRHIATDENMSRAVKVPWRPGT